MEGFTDVLTGQARRGFVEVVRELEQRFPDPAAIEKEADRKAFVKLFGEYLRVENVLQNFDEFASLKALQGLDLDDAAAVEAFKAQHHVDDATLAMMQATPLPPDRMLQDYRSTYNDIRDWLRKEKASDETAQSTIDWDDVVFEVDLLKSQEINPGLHPGADLRAQQEDPQQGRTGGRSAPGHSRQPGQPRQGGPAGGLH